MRLGAPQRSIEAGAVFASNDRKSEGLFLHQSVARNLLATRLKTVSHGGIINRGLSAGLAQRLAGLIGFDRKRLATTAETLSGGNQQKVFLGRCLEKEGVTLLMFDEPTRGVDVGWRSDIHNLIRHAASTGACVIFASTELDEIVDLADTVVTMFAGRITGIAPREDMTAADIPSRDDSRPSEEGRRVTGADSTTTKSGVSPATGRVAHFHFATLAVYAFVAVVATLIVFGAFATPGFLSIRNSARSPPPPRSSASSRSVRR